MSAWRLLGVRLLGLLLLLRCGLDDGDIFEYMKGFCGRDCGCYGALITQICIHGRFNIHPCMVYIVNTLMIYIGDCRCLVLFCLYYPNAP